MPRKKVTVATPGGDDVFSMRGVNNMTVDPSPFTGARVAPILTPVYARTLPTATGWYWHRPDGDFSNAPNAIAPFCHYVRVSERGAVMLKDLTVLTWAHLPKGGWWSGPIVAPEFTPPESQ